MPKLASLAWPASASAPPTRWRCDGSRWSQIVDEACISLRGVRPGMPARRFTPAARSAARCGRGAGRRDPDPEPGGHGALLPGHAGAGGQRLLRGRVPDGHRGVIGDELVAAEYLSLWRDTGWGTLIRSTDPVVVDTVRMDYPELVPYLAPVTIPAVAEARYLRAQHGQELRIVYAGVAAPPVGTPELDAAITFEDLEQIFQLRGVSRAGAGRLLRADARGAAAPPERGGRAAAGHARGGPLRRAAGSGRSAGCRHLPALARAVAVDRLDLGFVDLLSYEGALDHPLSGPRDELYWRRALLASAEPPRSRLPVVDGRVVASVGAVFDIRPRRLAPDPTAVAALLDAIGPGPNGRPWDCRACGFATCARFAEAAALGRATLRQCPPYQERRAEEAPREAAVDPLTGPGHLPGAAGPAGPRSRAQQAQRRRLRGAVPRPRPVQVRRTTGSGTRRATRCCGRWPARSGARSAPRTWRPGTAAMNSW